MFFHIFLLCLQLFVSFMRLIVKNKKKKTKQSMGGDIADYLDEEIVPYEELDESEKAACQMAAFLISGMILVIAGIVIPLF